uniref:Uncharacterized protein n=1 Tax=Heterorhabditis bacteriophora TaxID=37862 RepID=A0A1I7XK26_HETBA
MSELFATRSEQFQALEQVLAVRPPSSVLSPLFWGGVNDTILSQLISHVEILTDVESCKTRSHSGRSFCHFASGKDGSR